MSTTTTAPAQLDLFGLGERPSFVAATTLEVDQALARGAPVFMGVSGGKDSQALAYRVSQDLDERGHVGPRYLIHSDLGRVEWRQSQPMCERLSERLGIELIVVRRQAGDMMDRWLQRWSNNVDRYAELECVKLILPWSTPAQRFCTAELKSAILAREMRRRHPTGDVVSAVGIRREESSARAKMPVWRMDPRTMRRAGVGHTWHPLLHWSRADVLDYIRHRGDTVHEAYTLFQSSRVSCAFCIMSSLGDLIASASCSDNQAIYREMVELEVVSTFSFQGQRWLGDVAPGLLDASVRQRLQEAKERAAEREAAEAMLPPELLFVSGWPTFVPSLVQAALIAEVRRRVAQAVGLAVNYTDAVSVQARYDQLIGEAKRKAACRGDLVVEGTNAT
jgi:3'-phosphoadenosine 5'-phosphosulfate sulfotransferase (PAPS reductase)/FAD synthetase